MPAPVGACQPLTPGAPSLAVVEELDDAGPLVAPLEAVASLDVGPPIVDELGLCRSRCTWRRFRPSPGPGLGPGGIGTVPAREARPRYRRVLASA